MSLQRLSEELADERCGLYFLAGLDLETSNESRGLLTIHVADGAINQTQEQFIRSIVETAEPELAVNVKYHSARELHAPDSLESFVRLFQHEDIIADPTGAFCRAPGLLELAQSLRAELGNLVSRILWQAEYSTLVVIADSLGTEFAPSGQRIVSSELQDSINQVVDRFASPDLRRMIRTVRATTQAPSSSYVPVDALSVRAPVQIPKPAGLMARLAGITALIGIGMFSTANAATVPVAVPDQSAAPGILALSGLTSLGENALGVRNHYRAVGGLRLYFRESASLLSPIFGTGNDLGTAETGERTEPMRIAYGS